MKAKVLYWEWDDKSGNGIERLYLEPDFEEADEDLAMLTKHSNKNWMLVNVSVCNGGDYVINDVVKKAQSPDNVLEQKLQQKIIYYSECLSVRALNSLKRNKIETFQDLTAYSMDEYSRVRNNGKRTAKELDEFLRKHGLSFRQHNYKNA